MERTERSEGIGGAFGDGLLFVTGKGGVGKSALAAAAALALAGAGRRVLLLEIDPRESLHAWLGVAPSGGERVTLAPRLALESLRPRALVDRQVEERVPIRLLAERLLAHPLYQQFVDGAPGLEELAVLDHVERSLRGEFDCVVLDGAASGHALGQLQAPALVSEVVRSGPFARLAERLKGFVADPRRCRTLLVSTAEEMPVEETLELARDLQTALGQPAALLAINQLAPDELPAEGPGEEPPLVLWRHRLALQERCRERLLSDWRGAVVELPWLPLPRGAVLARALADRLSVASSMRAEAR
jgi:anion-transporting  ArsA/GET3 family ATPase